MAAFGPPHEDFDAPGGVGLLCRGVRNLIEPPLNIGWSDVGKVFAAEIEMTLEQAGVVVMGASL